MQQSLEYNQLIFVGSVQRVLTIIFVNNSSDTILDFTIKTVNDESAKFLRNEFCIPDGFPLRVWYDPKRKTFTHNKLGILYDVALANLTHNNMNILYEVALAQDLTENYIQLKKRKIKKK